MLCPIIAQPAMPPMKPVAVFDKFGQSGSPAELQEYYGLTASQIVSSAVQAWTMRRR